MPQARITSGLVAFPSDTLRRDQQRLQVSDRTVSAFRITSTAVFFTPARSSNATKGTPILRVPDHPGASSAFRGRRETPGYSPHIRASGDRFRVSFRTSSSDNWIGCSTAPSTFSRHAFVSSFGWAKWLRT